MKKENSQTGEDVNEIILESISDGVFTVDQDWVITSFNRAAEEITGTPREEAVGRFCWEVFRSNMCEGDCALRRTMKEGKSFVSSSTYIINNMSQRVPITVSTSPLRNNKGAIVGGVETFRDHSLVEELRKELSGGCEIGDMVSRSKVMKQLFSILYQVAESDSAVLIQGETGTGKELLAQALHNLSLRKENPFIAINCGALPDSLLESELFGFKSGAFTGADRDKIGLFAAADSGTIFLDEIGETSSAFQIRLLRVLEEREFQPLGSVTKIPVNVRVVAATNRNLRDMVESGEFRRDLFYRINIMHLELPPLRERMEDIPLLVERFIEKMNRLRGKAVTGVSTETMSMLLHHDYPGNIRELENIIEHAFILCHEGEIGITHLPAYLQPVQEHAVSISIAENRRQSEKETIMAALHRNNYNRLAAAKDLGIHKTTLFRKLKKYRLSLPDKDGRRQNK